MQPAPQAEPATNPAGATGVTRPPEDGRGLPGPARDLQGWLSQLRIHRRDDGGLSIEAPPEAADGLAALFEGMGRLLQEARAARG